MLFRINTYLVSLLILLLSLQSFSGIYGNTEFVEKERTETEKSNERNGTELETAFSDIIVTAFQRNISPGNLGLDNNCLRSASTASCAQFLSSPPQRLSSNYLPFICVFRL